MADKPLKDTIRNIFDRLSSPEIERKTALMRFWPEIAGPYISKHTAARLGPDKQVRVWVDDSTLAFELGRKHKPALLKRLKNQFGEEEVKDVRFFVGELRA